MELRPHQVKMVEEVFSNWENGTRSQLLWGVTGIGKTEIAISIMKGMAEKYMTCAMVMDRIVLVEQTSLRLGKYGVDHGVMQASHWRFRPHERIQVCSIQTIGSRKRQFKPDVLIIDECHVKSKVVQKIMDQNPEMKVLGLTATPFTNGLGNIYEKIVAGPTYKEIIEKGWLVPLKVYIAKQIDMTGAKKVAGEWSSEEVTSRAVTITGDVVTEWETKTHEIFGKPEKTICFCAGVNHGKNLEEQFKARGYNFVSISYLEEDDYKREVINEFSKPDSSIHGLIATDILTRGFDVSDVKIGISARPFSKSLSSHIQQIGRTMRPHPSKTFGLWLDFSGNYLRFMDDWDSIYNEGVKKLEDGKEKTKKEPTEREKEEKKCPKCKALWVWRSDECGECGYKKPRVSQVVSVAGKMEALTAPSPIEDQQRFYSELIGYAMLKQYKPGWAWHKYKTKYNAEPKHLKREPVYDISPKTASWIKSQNIKFAKSKRRYA